MLISTLCQCLMWGEKVLLMVFPGNIGRSGNWVRSHWEEWKLGEESLGRVRTKSGVIGRSENWVRSHWEEWELDEESFEGVKAG